MFLREIFGQPKEEHGFPFQGVFTKLCEEYYQRLYEGIYRDLYKIRLESVINIQNKDERIIEFEKMMKE
jgi:hypothetical protein